MLACELSQNYILLPGIGLTFIFIKLLAIMLMLITFDFLNVIFIDQNVIPVSI